MRRLVVLAFLSLPLADSACRVFSGVEDCTSDADCAGNARCDPDGRFCEKLTEVRVGVTLGLTGSVQGLSEVMKQGLDFAVAAVNAEGGVLGGARLVLDVLDDQGDDDLAAANAATLVARNVVAVIGPLRSAQVLKAQAMTYPAKVLELSPLGGAGALGLSQPPHDRYLFQTIASIHKGSAAALVRYASKLVDDPPRATPACTTMAVLHTDDVTGSEFRDAVVDTLPKHGGCVTLDVPFPPTLKADYAAEVARLVAARPDCSLLVALPTTGAAVLREFATQKAADTTHDWSQFQWFGTTTLHTDDFLLDARADKSKPTPTVAEGFMGTDDDGAPPTAEYADYAFAWKTAYGNDPPALSAEAYDALILVALAIEHAGSAHDRVKLRDSLYDVSLDGDRVPAFGPGTVGDALRAARRGLRINYQGASGAIEFDDYGVVRVPTLIWNVVDGAFPAKPVIRYTEAQAAAIDDNKAPRTCP